MTKVKDIVAGNYCPDCAADCRNFVTEADCCLYSTWISQVYSETVEDQSEKEVHYEPVEQNLLLTEMDREVLFMRRNGNKWIMPEKGENKNE